MCGIIGIAGKEPVSSEIIKGLKKLEYRGYDSAGLAIFDNDQINDLLIVGNMYHAEIETARNDAGNGLLLKGVGDGSFKEVSVSESGFFAPGDSKKNLTLNNR